MRLALFPLNTVLFPGQVLPLHIFEPRYRQMVSACLAQGVPFGVVLIQKGVEVGEAAQHTAVGTTARIAQVHTLDDGRMDILSVGEQRFEILEVHSERPYLEATTRLLKWPDEESPDLEPLAGNVLARLQRYLADRGHEASPDALAEFKGNPVLVATAAAAVPDLSLIERQRLLELPTLQALLRREADLLQQEDQLLRALRVVDAGPLDPESPFNPN